MDLSIIIPAYNEAENLKLLLKDVRKAVSVFTQDYEIIVADGGSTDGTERCALEEGAVFFRQEDSGYGSALKEAFGLARGRYIITMDADLSHSPVYIDALWENKEKADLVIASRYVDGGRADMPPGRKILSIVLNRIYTWILSLPYKDISSGFRMYNSSVLKGMRLRYSGFSALQEILTYVHCGGYKILEVPFAYEPRRHGSSTVRLFKMAFSYLATLFSMWRLRNSVESADYDDRAYNSRILPQRMWQRKRYSIIMDMVEGAGAVLDIGCGTSRIIGSLPHAVGMDINHKALRYLKKARDGLVEADIAFLPFKDRSFDAVICSEVIEHIPKNKFDLRRMRDALSENGVLILGTPDYGRIFWRIVEWVYGKVIPGGYAKQHITHYTSSGMERLFVRERWQIIEKRCVFGMEVIYKITPAP